MKQLAQGARPVRWGVNAKVHALPIVPTCTRLCQDVPRPHMWGCSRDLSREGSCSRPEQSTWGEDQREATFRSPQAAQPTAEGCQTPDLRRAQGAFWRIFRFTQHPACIVPPPARRRLSRTAVQGGALHAMHLFLTTLLNSELKFP